MSHSESIIKNNDATMRPILLSIMASSLMPTFLSSSVNVALPVVGKEFGMNAASLSWISTAYLLAAAVFLVPFGRAADIYGRKRIFFWGNMLLTVSSVLCVFTQSGWQLIILRILQGVGGCMLSSTGIAIISSVYPSGERGKALGMIGITSYVGMSAGPTLGGVLTEHFGWRSIFIACSVLGLVILFTVLKFMRTEWTEAKGEKYDIGGTLIYCISLILLLCGFTFLQQAYGLILLIVGIAGAAFFAVWASKAKSPVVNLSLFKGNRVFIFSTIAALINYGIIFVISYILSLYLQYICGLSPQYAGIVLITQPLLQAMFSPIAGRLSDRMESRKVACIGMILNCIGLILLIFIGDNTPLIYIVISLIFEGLGCAFFISPNQNTVMNSVEKQSYGVASGILATMRNIGQMICMAIATICLTAYIGNSQITSKIFPDFLKSIHLTFVIMTALGVLGIFSVLIKIKKRFAQSEDV